MSSIDDSPSSWQLLLDQARTLADSPGKSVGVPGGEGSSAQMVTRPSPSVRGTMFDDVVVVYVRDGPGVDVCGGKIGTNQARFCVKPCEPGKTGCQYASHVAKANLKFPAYYVHYPKGTTAFCEPVLLEPSEGFSEVIQNTLKGERPPAEWARIFPTLSIAATLEGVQQIDMITRGEREVPIGPTPMKRRMVLFEEGLDFGRTGNQEAADLADSTPGKSEGTSTQMHNEALMAEGIGETEAVEHISLYWNDMIELSTSQREDLKELESVMRANLEEVDDKVVNVSAVVGNKPQGTDLPLTLWSSVASAHENLTDLRGRVTVLDETSKLSEARVDYMASELIAVTDSVKNNVVPTVDSLRNTLSALELKVSNPATSGQLNAEILAADHEVLLQAQQAAKVELENVKVVLTQMASNASFMKPPGVDQSYWKKEAERLQRSNQELEVVILKLAADQQTMSDQLKELKDVQEKEGGEVQFSEPSTADALRTEMYTMRRSMEDLRREVKDGREGGPQGNLGMRREVSDVSDVMALIASMSDQLNILQLDQKSLRSEIVTEAMAFGGHSFLTEDSYSKFIVKYFPSAYYGYCVDFISILELSSDQNRTTQEGLKNMKTITGAGFVNSNEGIIYASFGTFFPALFGIEHDAKDPLKKMGSMTDVREWDPRTSRAGRKNTINNYLSAMKRSMELQITAASHKMKPEASIFFRNLVLNTWSFWEALASWISRFEDEMCSLTPGDNPETHRAQIWNLICWMLHSMFVEMGVRRAGGGVATMIDKEDKVSVCAAVLQGTLGAHKFMKELMDNDFGRHPLFASTMVEFLITTKAPYLAVEELRSAVKRIDATTRMLQGNKDRKGVARGDS